MPRHRVTETVETVETVGHADGSGVKAKGGKEETKKKKRKRTDGVHAVSDEVTQVVVSAVAPLAPSTDTPTTAVPKPKGTRHSLVRE